MARCRHGPRGARPVIRGPPSTGRRVFSPYERRLAAHPTPPHHLERSLWGARIYSTPEDDVPRSPWGQLPTRETAEGVPSCEADQALGGRASLLMPAAPCVAMTRRRADA